MISKTTFTFLKNLQKNNNKPWFDENRTAYENAKADVLQFCAEMIKQLGKIDAGIALLEPKRTMFRINRDVRFSKDKRPYKNNMGVYFNADGKKTDTAGYYVHIEPGACFIAAGMWQPPGPVLSKIRQEIDYNFAEWKKIVGSVAFKKNTDGLSTDDKLVRPPKGYDENNPAVEFLKHKSFVATKKLEDAVLQEKNAVVQIVAVCKSLQPLVLFLNRGLDG